MIKYLYKKSEALFAFFEDFSSFEPTKAVSKALECLEIKGDITRVARGLYTILGMDKANNRSNCGSNQEER